jgi:hypothetical protein
MVDWAKADEANSRPAAMVVWDFMVSREQYKFQEMIENV